MDLLSGIPVQVLVIGLISLVGLQIGLMFRLVNKQNRKIEASFLTLERQVKASVSYSAESLYEELKRITSYQNIIFQTVDEKLTRLERRSLSDVSKTANSGSSPLDKKHQVVSLAQKGMDCEGISRRLRLSRGEAELLLRLKDRYSTETEDDSRTM